LPQEFTDKAIVSFHDMILKLLPGMLVLSLSPALRTKNSGLGLRREVLGITNCRNLL